MFQFLCMIVSVSLWQLSWY